MAKRGGFPGGMPGQHEQPYETGAEKAASDGRSTERIRRKRDHCSSRWWSSLKLPFPVRERLQK